MSCSRNSVACSASRRHSQKRWLRHAHHAERGQVKAVLRAGDEVIPEREETTDNYESPKDDRFVVFPGNEDWVEFRAIARK